ncbi:MAG: alpha/beta hydrolase-fold protein [Myxococcales bacterium]|nr:alpha/beta hydrolase-fold protein [Polyangiaceae bacterium]MDW8249972.1 alpha/beta hydrolase-fold protein [Myxococcales bacterium]
MRGDTSPSYQVHRGFPSPPEGFQRVVRVYRPPTPPGTRHRLLVMQDGQNLLDFDHDPSRAPWGVNEGLNTAMLQASGPPWLLVAVDHRGVDRMGDYSPWPDPRLPVEARGQRYGEFVAEHLIPWARSSLPVLDRPEDTAIAGSSLGGLIALFIAWRYPEVVRRVAAFSPSVMWSSRQIFRYWSRHPGGLQRIYLDTGSREYFEVGEVTLDYGLDVAEFHGHLQAVGYSNQELRLVRDPLGQHSERDWRRRFPTALRWLSSG